MITHIFFTYTLLALIYEIWVLFNLNSFLTIYDNLKTKDWSKDKMSLSEKLVSRMILLNLLWKLIGLICYDNYFLFLFLIMLNFIDTSKNTKSVLYTEIVITILVLVLIYYNYIIKIF